MRPRGDLNDIAGKHHAFISRPVQNAAASKVSAEAYHTDVLGEFQGVAIPKFNPRAVAHYPLAVVGMEINGSVKFVSPVLHGGVVMRMRNRDGLKPAQGRY